MKKMLILAVTVGLIAVLSLGSVAQAQDLIPVRLQLQWVTQSQFAGYYAAVDQGFYEAEGLDVTILEGAVGHPEYPQKHPTIGMDCFAPVSLAKQHVFLRIPPRQL